MENTALSVSSVEEVSSLETDCPAEIDPGLWARWQGWDKLPADDFLHMVQLGKLGHNVGLGNGLTKINNYIYGTHRARYYLIGADSNVGKTTITDFMYILKGWEEAKRLGRKFKCYYCSFEISKADKIARWVSYYIFLKFGVRLPTDYFLGRIEGRKLKPEHERMVIVGYQAVTEIMKDIVWLDTMATPTEIFEGIIVSHYEKNGTVKRQAVPVEAQKKGKKGAICGFSSNDNTSIIMLMADHMALAALEGLDIKSTMDKLSKYAVVLRNLFGTTCVFIQQFSTDLMGANRQLQMKKSEASIAPNRLDFGDSKATFRDADIVLGYTKPNQYLNEFMKYNLSPIDGLGDCMVAQYLLKNRYGPSNRVCPLFLDGVSGIAYDLPPEPLNMLLMQEWYDKAKQIEKVCLEYCPQK